METTFKMEDIQSAIDGLISRYQQEAFAIEVDAISGGYQFMTKPHYHHTVGTYLKQQSTKKLSRSALETLSIIAYRQPVTKADLEAIRGVNCDYTIQKLMEKDLVEISGRSESPGRPLLYSTSPKFMDYFGLHSLEDLPKLRDLQTPDQEIGEESIEVESLREEE